MLAPAVAIVIAFAVLAVGLRLAAGAATELRGSLRRSSATAVAGDELMRAAATVGDHAEATRAAADMVRPAQRGRSRPRPRR